ncbi:MAG TPA: TerB family tellurite resistance protein [Vicinamibacterales bacterium]|nr:TerB family tellurite resistance protein [Vicinamibacterales bacterium]
MSIWRWLGIEKPSAAPADDDALGAIETALASLAPERARYLACFAYVLTRGARADHGVTDDEIGAMERLVADRGGIPPAEAGLVVRLAVHQSFRSGASDDFGVTREFNALASHDQKLALIDCLFAVCASDASVLTIEDNEIRRIARELRIEHADFVAIRGRYRDRLEVLRKRDST